MVEHDDGTTTTDATIMMTDATGATTQEISTTILLVEQNAKMALSVAHRGYVLETGKVVSTGTGKDLLNDESVKKAYLGG